MEAPEAGVATSSFDSQTYSYSHQHGWISNSVIIFTISLSFVLAIVAIPLEFLGG